MFFIIIFQQRNACQNLNVVISATHKKQQNKHILYASGKKGSEMFWVISITLGRAFVLLAIS